MEQAQIFDYVSLFTFIRLLNSFLIILSHHQLNLMKLSYTESECGCCYSCLMIARGCLYVASINIKKSSPFMKVTRVLHHSDLHSPAIHLQCCIGNRCVRFDETHLLSIMIVLLTTFPSTNHHSPSSET